jgi:hypothetical protein
MSKPPQTRIDETGAIPQGISTYVTNPAAQLDTDFANSVNQDAVDMGIGPRETWTKFTVDLQTFAVETRQWVEEVCRQLDKSAEECEKMISSAAEDIKKRLG